MPTIHINASDSIGSNGEQMRSCTEVRYERLKGSRRGGNVTGVMIAIIVVVVVLGIIVAMLPTLLAKRGVTMMQTRFGLTLIFETENADGTPVRLLNVNGTFQSVSYVPEDLRFELACEYHRAMADIIWELACERRREAQADTSGSTPDVLRVLVMGGGGYSLPKYLATYVPNAVTDVVEIDPSMTKLAREQFFLDECLENTHAEEEGRLNLINGDAWEWLLSSTEPYDVIVNDAFSGNKPLGTMKTDEGAHVVHEHLTENGVYLANVRCKLEGRSSKVINEVEEAFGKEFSHVWYVPEWPDDPSKPGNNALCATDRELTLPKDAVVVR